MTAMTDRTAIDTLSQLIPQRTRIQIERRLNELGSLVKGNQDFQADRIADVLEQIDEVRDEVKAMNQRLERIAVYLNKQKNGEEV